MVTRARKVTELPFANTLNDDDLFVVDKTANGSSTTSRITFGDIKRWIVAGPYSDDIEANTGGLEIGELYYTEDGSVKVRLT